MSENVVSWLVIASEVGASFALILFVVVFMIMRARIRKKSQAKELVGRVKNDEQGRRDMLVNKVKDMTSLDDEKVSEVIEAILGCEKNLYKQFVRAYMGYDKDAINSIDNQVMNLEDSFVGLVKATAESAPQSGGEEDDAAALEQKKQITRLRDEKVLLKEKNTQLQTDFDAAMESMERMTLEYAQMYEGGSKEGEQRMKNEMYQLKQKLSGDNKHAEEGDAGGDDVPDLDTDGS